MPSHSNPQVPRSRNWLLASALGLALGLALAASLTLWHLRQDAIETQMRELGLLSLALSDELDRGLQGAAEGLHAIADELQQQRLPMADEDATRALHTRADLMPLVTSLWLLDGNRRVIASSGESHPPDAASFMPTLDALEGDALAISRPFGEAAAREPAIALAVRFAAPSGAPGGWIVGSVPAKSVLGAFSVASKERDARMAVVRRDGARLAGSIVASPSLGEADLAQRLAEYSGPGIRAFRDGSERLVVMQDLPRYRLKVVMTRDVEAVLAAWRQMARITSFALLALLTATVVSAHLIRRANRRHAEAQLALQMQLARAGKLQALGTLAGGVAHDFNNILAAILGFAEMARDAAPEGSEQARELDRVMEAALRGKRLVDRILTFSRGGSVASTVFDLEPIVEEVLTLLTTSLPPGVALHRRLEAPDGRVRGDPTQAFEAVMNLCTNAMQAMPNGGSLAIHLRRARIDVHRVLSHSELAPGSYLELTVSDNGIGITPDVTERLFEPFFTTRSEQSGTGLGLAVVHGVVADFGGAIDVRSTPGDGSDFTVYLPECREAAGPAAPSADFTPTGTGQRVMVVDDVPALVEMTLKMLSGLGYDPVGFGDPEAALRAIREDPEGFAAVVADEVMPGMSGTQLADALREVAPEVPVLLVSGYGGSMLATRAATSGVTRVLAKPLERAELARALAEALR